MVASFGRPAPPEPEPSADPAGSRVPLHMHVTVVPVIDEDGLADFRERIRVETAAALRDAYRDVFGADVDTPAGAARA